jgi:hypothetical protein
MIVPAYNLTAAEKSLPKLTLSWLTGSVQTEVDVIRANSATFIGSNGLVQLASADTQRIDYTTGIPGLLVEESRTNELTYSEDFRNTATAGETRPWGWVRITVQTATEEETLSPDGTANASRVIETLTTGNHALSNLFSSISGVSYTTSVFVKPNGRNIAIEYSSAFGATQRILADLTAKTTTLQAGSATSTIQELTNGWFRVSMTATATATASVGLSFYPANGTARNYEGDGTSGIYLWGSQTEQGAEYTSYIPTVDTAVTRSADDATITGANFSDWYNSAKGTFRADFTSIATGNRPIFAIDDNTANENLIVKTQGNVPTFEVKKDNISQASVTAGTVTANTTAFAYVSYDANFFGIARPTARQVDTAGAVPTVDQMRIGSDQAGNYFNGTIQQIQFWP